MSGIRIDDYLPLSGLRALAKRGGDRGPTYDRGVLDAIAVLERDGSIREPSIANLVILWGIQISAGADVLTEQETETAAAFMRANAWEFEQAEEYCRGYDSVQQVAKQLGIGVI